MSGLFTTRRPGCTPCSVRSLGRGDSCAHRKAVLRVSHIQDNGRGCLLAAVAYALARLQNGGEGRAHGWWRHGRLKWSKEAELICLLGWVGVC